MILLERSFNEVMNSAMKSLTIDKDKDKVLYLDTIESIVECYDAPYYMCRFPDRTVLMVPKELISVDQMNRLCLTKNKPPLN